MSKHMFRGIDAETDAMIDEIERKAASKADDKLEMKLMDLFIATEQFGQKFMTGATKEEFAEAVKNGALDHQEAAHKAMQLIQARDEQRESQVTAPKQRSERTLEFVMSEVGGEGSAQALFVKEYIDGKEYLSLATPYDVLRAKVDELDQLPTKQQVLGYGGSIPYVTKDYLRERRQELKNKGKTE